MIVLQREGMKHRYNEDRQGNKERQRQQRQKIRDRNIKTDKDT